MSCPRLWLGGCFYGGELRHHRRIFVVSVERIAAGGQAVARGGCAIAEGAADELVLEGLSLRSVEKDRWIGENHASEAGEVDPAFADGGLGDVGKEILEVAVGGAGDDEVRKFLFELLDRKSVV